MIITYKQIAEALTEIVWINELDVDDIDELIETLAEKDGSVWVMDD